MKIRFSLMEAVRYATLLTESQRRDFVLKNHGAQLEKAFLSGHVAADVRAQIDPEFNLDGGAGEFGPNELAGRIIDYIASHDPSTKKIYTLWMTQRHLKGEMPLEDMPGVENYLAFFDANKLRFTKRDIGQYRTVDELATAVNAFSEKSAPAEKLRNDADMKVIYDSPNLSIVQPKTAEGATELAGDAIWCTAWQGGRNRFYAYKDAGPIYVIIDKKRKKRWQFFFPNPRSNTSAEFMDRSNTAINLKEFLIEYPKVFEVLGETAFLPYIHKLGLSFFSAAAIRSIPEATLSEIVSTVQDLSALPDDVVNHPDFAQALILRLTGQYNGEETIKATTAVVNYYIDKVPDELFTKILVSRPLMLKMLPKRMVTEENKIAAARSLGYVGIVNHVPKPWSEAIETEYWTKRIQNDTSLYIGDTPEKYITFDRQIVLLMRRPSDISKYAKLTQDLVNVILSRDHTLIEHVPEKFLNKTSAEIMINAIDRSNDGYHRASLVQKLGKKFKMADWPFDAAEQLIKSSQAQDASYEDLPKLYRDDARILDLWVKSEPKNFVKLPAAERTSSRLELVLAATLSGHAIKLFTPEICSPHMFAATLEKSLPGIVLAKDQYLALPKYLHTEEIVRQYIEKGVVPIKEMGSLINTAAILARSHYNEVADIPARLMNEQLASELVTRLPTLVAQLPKAMLTEEVLYHWLKAVDNSPAHYVSTYHTGKGSIPEAFALFPKSAWSQRTLPLAVSLRALPADLAKLPKEFLSRELVGAVAGHDEEMLDHEDAHIIDEENICNAIKKNWKVYTKLRPDQIVEATMYAFVSSTASRLGTALKQNSGHYIQDWVKELVAQQMPIYEAMPKAKWSARCWEEVVGLIYPLGKVPARFRNSDKMIALALQRDASQAQYIDNPTQWLDANAKTLLAGKADDKTWKEQLLLGGIFKTGRNYVDVADLPHKPLSNGNSYVIVDSGKINLRMFLFDRKNKVIVRLYTQDGTIKSSSFNEIKANKPVVREFALMERSRLSDFSPGVINYAGVQRNSAGELIPEEKMRRDHHRGEALTWAVGSYGSGGTLRLAFKGDKMVLKIIEQMSSGAFGNSGSMRIDEIIPFVKLSQLHLYAKDMADYFNRNDLEGWRGTPIGLGNGSRHNERWEVMTSTKIAELGALTVWRGQDRYEKTISIYHETKGRLGSAVVRKNGNFDKIDVRGDEGFAKEINALFDSLNGKVPFHPVK